MTRSELIQRTVAGFMDVINIDKTGENFGLIYDTKVYFAVHHTAPEERPSTSCTTWERTLWAQVESHIWWLMMFTPSATLIPSARWMTSFRLIWRLVRLLISSSLTLCKVTGGANLGRIGVTSWFFWCGSCQRCQWQQLCHPALQHFCYWQRQQTMDFSSPRKMYSPHHCQRERQETEGQAELEVTWLVESLYLINDNTAWYIF